MVRGVWGEVLRIEVRVKGVGRSRVVLRQGRRGAMSVVVQRGVWDLVRAKNVLAGAVPAGAGR